MAARLVLLRHGQCCWESEGRFVGWADTALTEVGATQAVAAGELFRDRGFHFDRVHTSVLRRAVQTQALAVEAAGARGVPVVHSWRLNARHYGQLQGRQKADVVAEFGSEQVYAWRRDAGVAPPPLAETDDRHPRNSDLYRDHDGDDWLATECFGDCRERLMQYWQQSLVPALRDGGDLLVAAHGSSLRPLVEHLSHVEPDDIVALNLPTGVPLVYELDGNGEAASWFFLGDREAPAPLAMPALHRGLEDLGVCYVVLSGLPGTPGTPTRAPALLVREEDVGVTRELLQRFSVERGCQVYGTLGRSGSGYRKLPYLPPHLAEEVFSQRQRVGGVPVPSAEHRFMIAAFDRVYHGGDVDVRRLVVDRTIGCSPDELAAYLDAHGWRPPQDLLGRMSWCNSWVGEQLGRYAADADPDPGLTVFTLRRAAMERGGLDWLTARLNKAGFEILATRSLSADQITRGQLRIRSGKWDRGPWPASGGPLAALVVAYDLEPMPVSAEQRARFPWLSNGRTLVKEQIRAQFNEGLPPADHCNVLHATDTSTEASETIELLIPEVRSSLAARIEAMQASYRTAENVVERLTRFGRRAKVEVVEYQGELVVKKTFKPSQLRFCCREQEAGEALGHIPQLPKLVAADDNWVMFEYHPSDFRFDRSAGVPLPLHIAAAAISALKAVYDAGYALLDARPENLLVTAHGVMLIDHEFLHRYSDRPPSFAESWDVAGCPESFTGDRPKGGATSYARDWQPFIGLSLHNLLQHPIWLEQCRSTRQVRPL